MRIGVKEVREEEGLRGEERRREMKEGRKEMRGEERRLGKERRVNNCLLLLLLAMTSLTVAVTHIQALGKAHIEI